MTDTALTIILASIPATIGAITAAIVALKSLRQSKVNSFKADEQIAKTEVAVAKTEEVSKKADEIHTLTNGRLGQVNTELQVALKEISGMKDLIVALTEAAKPLGVPGPPGPAGPVGPVGPKGDSGKK